MMSKIIVARLEILRVKNDELGDVFEEQYEDRVAPENQTGSGQFKTPGSGPSL